MNYNSHFVKRYGGCQNIKNKTTVFSRNLFCVCVFILRDFHNSMHICKHTRTHIYVYFHCVKFHCVYIIYIYVYTVDYYSAFTKEKILTFATTWMNLKYIILNKISHT